MPMNRTKLHAVNSPATRTVASQYLRRRVAKGREPARKAQPIDRRATILRAAARRFAEFGYESTTIRQIADDANLQSGSLYHYFATKEDMLHGLVRDVMLRMQGDMTRVSLSRSDAETKLVEIGRASCRERVCPKV